MFATFQSANCIILSFLFILLIFCPTSEATRAPIELNMGSINSSSSRSDGRSDELPQPAQRIRNEPESVWVEFVELGLKNKPLNLGQGFPDFAAPQFLLESLRNASQQVAISQYTRSFGHPRLVRALVEYYSKVRNFTQLRNPNEQVLVTVGAYEALFCSVLAFVEPGEQVLIVEPAFDAYKPMVEFAQGKAQFIPLRNTNKTPSNFSSSAHFKLDMNELEQAVSRVGAPKTKMLILNTPNNPLGKVYTKAEMLELARFCNKHNLIVIADEVYEQLYFEGQSEHLSIAQISIKSQENGTYSALDDMWRRTITIGSAGKTFSVTGWKIGWAFGPAELIRYVQLVHQTTLYTVATPLQEAIAQAFERETGLILEQKPGQHYWSSLRADLVAKRDRMATILRRAGLEPILPEAGYFMMADITKLAQQFASDIEQQPKASANRPNSLDYKLARWLSNEKKLQVIPASAFYDQSKELGSKYVRFCFIKDESTLDKLESLMERLQKDALTIKKPKL